jgi:hypothetical protein
MEMNALDWPPRATLPRQRVAGRHSSYGIASDMAQKLARTQGTSRRGLNTHSMDYQVTYQHSLRSAPEDFIVHVPSQMVCNVPATVDEIIQRLCPSGVLPQSAFGGNRRCRRCAWLQGDAIFSTLRVRSGRRAAGSLNATQLIRLISIETTGKRRNECAQAFSQPPVN